MYTVAVPSGQTRATTPRSNRRKPRVAGADFLSFRCTGCGNCCKDPLLPLTDADLRRILRHTGERAMDVVRFVSRHQIDLDDEPESFADLRQGRRVMVLAHGRRGCRYLGTDDRCGIYNHRPVGCRVFPFDPLFYRDGRLRRLRLIPATDCEYELDGTNDVAVLRSLTERHDTSTEAYQAKLAEWNRDQRSRRRRGFAARTGADFLRFLGF